MHHVVGIINSAKKSVAITSCVQHIIIERGQSFTMSLWSVKPKEK